MLSTKTETDGQVEPTTNTEATQVKKGIPNKKTVLIVIGVLLLLCFGCCIFGSLLPKSSPGVVNDTIKPIITQGLTTPPTTKVMVTNSPLPTNTVAPTATLTVSQRNALTQARTYLSIMSFSHDGLVAQLEFEQYSHVDAVYAADNCGADWNEQAAKKAATYMSTMSFSRGGLIDQLKFEKFTQSQAEYGAKSVGL